MVYLEKQKNKSGSEYICDYSVRIRTMVFVGKWYNCNDQMNICIRYNNEVFLNKHYRILSCIWISFLATVCTSWG